MTEPPRPPGDSNAGPPPDPTSPPPPFSVPGEAPAPGYAPPPSTPPPPGPPPGGGYPPPGGGYAPPGGGYPPGGYPAGAPAGYATNDEKTWALIAHFGGALGMFVGAGCAGWLAPLIAMLAKGNESPTVRQHAVAALNFQLLWSIIGIIGWATACLVIGFFIMFAAMIIGVVFGIIAGIKANEGQLYRYPMTVNIVK